MKLADMAQVH
jgi:glycylpeptide N-tetradecanoyltransferase